MPLGALDYVYDENQMGGDMSKCAFLTNNSEFTLTIPIVVRVWLFPMILNMRGMAVLLYTPPSLLSG